MIVRPPSANVLSAFVIALCLIAMAGGVSLLRLSLAEGFGGAADLRALAADPIAGAMAALEAAAADPDAPPAQRVRDLETLLRLRPNNGGAWLDLAIARRAAGGAKAGVEEALNGSAVHAPREARTMAGRALFALPFFEAASPGVRAQVATDLAGVANSFEPAGRRRVMALLDAQTPADRAELCAALANVRPELCNEAAP